MIIALSVGETLGILVAAALVSSGVAGFVYERRIGYPKRDAERKARIEAERRRAQEEKQ